MLKKRLAVSIPLVAVVLLAFFWAGLPGALVFCLFAAILIVTAVLEFSAMTKSMGYPGMPKMMSLFALLLLALAALPSMLGSEAPSVNAELEILVLFLFLAGGFVRIFHRPPKPENLIGHFVCMGGFIYVCWTLTFIAKLYFSSGLDSGGRYLTLFLLTVTKLGDIGGFVAGTLTAKRPGGNHKLAPVLSPKKSWEGLLGSIGFSVVGAVGLYYLLGESFVIGHTPVLDFKSVLFFGLLFPVLGLVGDLAESGLKRASGSKDSGRLPGLGGALDLLDSLILVAPVFYCYVRITYVLVG